MLLSAHLVELIREHAEELADTLAHKIRNHPDLPNFAKRTPADLKNWCADQIRSLSSSLLAEGEDFKRYRLIGVARFKESKPLHEPVLGLFLLKETIADFVRQRGYPMGAVDLYAEEDLERRIGRFFDTAVYHLVCGYEEGMHAPRASSWRF